MGIEGNASLFQEESKNAREYFDEFEERDIIPYEVINETKDTIEINIRPGLLIRAIAAGAAVEKNKVVVFKMEKSYVL